MEQSKSDCAWTLAWYRSLFFLVACDHRRHRRTVLTHVLLAFSITICLSLLLSGKGSTGIQCAWLLPNRRHVAIKFTTAMPINMTVVRTSCNNHKPFPLFCSHSGIYIHRCCGYTCVPKTWMEQARHMCWSQRPRRLFRSYWMFV